MEEKKLSHIDERLGHVAVDMGLLDRDQVAEINYSVVMAADDGATITFEQAAKDLGFLTGEQLIAVRAEERRRRRLINGYEIIDIIGTGNVATVYHARQLAMDREVALKILHPRLAADPKFVEDYIAEAQAVSRFHHPHIVQGFDAGESNGFYYFAHEYLSGGSMADRLASGRDHFSENRVLMYLRQTNSALRHAWAVAVYHGDINPGNLLLDGHGDIKLANLGVPRVAGMRDLQGVRRPGFVRCGPEYAAPEQLESPETVNARTDMYSLGATFYHISFGVPPFPGKTPEELLAARSINPVPSFALRSQESFSGKYLRLLHDMLEADPQKRPSDPEELSERLELFHLADTDELSGLAKQVRQVGGGGHVVSARSSIRVAAPTPPSDERNFSLRRRHDASAGGVGRFWWAASIILAIAIVVWLFMRT